MRHETAIAPQPRIGALDDPAPSDKLEAGLVVGALDNLQGHRLIGEFSGKLVAGIAAVGEDVGDEDEQPPRPADEIGGAVAILHAGRDHLDAQEEPDRVDDEVALDALDLLARVIPDRIGRAPPFSVAFTLWVSMMAAVGDASRPSASRHRISSA